MYERSFRGVTMEITLSSKQEYILGIAKQFFAEKGYSATGIREIAQEAGISLGNFYNYFKNKEELFACLMKPDRVMEPLRDIKKLLNSSFPFNLKEILIAIKRAVDKEFFGYRLIFIDLTEFNGLYTNRILEHIIHEATNNFNENVKTSIVGTVIREGDYQFYIKTFIMSILSILVIEKILPQAKFNEMSDDEFAEKISDIILHGILL